MNTTAQNAAAVDTYVNAPTATGSTENHLQQLVRTAVMANVRIMETLNEGMDAAEKANVNGKARGLAEAAEIATGGNVTVTMIVDAAFARVHSVA